MRSQIENWLLSYWYGPKPPPWILRRLEPLYRSIFSYQTSKADTASDPYSLRAALVVVGNITAGGTGKTPLVIRLSQLAGELGLKVGIASTGYGRAGREIELVTPESDPGSCGDEPVLLAQRTRMPVVVANKRPDAIKTLDAQGVDIIISDDGLQQAGLSGDIEICVVDGSRGLGNGFQIPAGPLREPVERLYRVNYVVSNGPWQKRPEDLDVYQMDLRGSTVCSLNGETSLPLDTFRKKHIGSIVHAVAGIGNPDRFFNMLGSLGFTTKNHSFPDHHSFTAKDFIALKDASPIIMTEKDAVKCRALGLENTWYLPVNCQLSEEFESRLKEHMKSLTGNLE